MKKYIKSNDNFTAQDYVIHIVMYIVPLIYENSEVVASVSFDSKNNKYHTDINPFRQINGPLSGPGEPLENPVAEEWECFVDDCKWLIQELGFTIISSSRSDDSQKSEYIIIFGMKDAPCGTLIYELRLSDHPFDATFPEELKDKTLEYLKINKILDGSAHKAGIDFQVEKVTVGTVSNDSWDKSFNRVYMKLRDIRRRIRARLNVRGRNKDI